MNRPTVSFLIVAYNAGGWLRPCVASAFAQAGCDVDVVLVDNASTDGSVADVARAFGNAPLKIVTAPRNFGPYAGAEFGFPFCRGEFVARMDADDVSLPHRIAQQLKEFTARPELAVVGSDAIMVDSAGRAVGAALALRSSWLRRRVAAYEIGIPHPTALFRRKALEEVFYNKTLFSCGDLELIEYFARRGVVGVSPEVLYVYRQHGGSITSSRAGLQVLSGCVLRHEVLNRYDPCERKAARARDFSYLADDPRQHLDRRALLEEFSRLSASQGNPVTAVYFRSAISPLAGTWAAFMWSVKRPGAIARIAEILFVRLFYPVWKRYRQHKLIQAWEADPKYAV